MGRVITGLNMAEEEQQTQGGSEQPAPPTDSGSSGSPGSDDSTVTDDMQVGFRGTDLSDLERK